MFHYNYFYITLFLFNYCLSSDINEQCLISDTCIDSSKISPSVYNDELYIQSRNCFCDDVCEEYGDCCYSTGLSLNKYECVDFHSSIINNKIPPFYPLSIWMRSECLSKYIGSNFDKQCRNLNNELFVDNPILFIPVTSIQTNITYRNYYCAYCNNDANDNIQFWEYKTMCPGMGTGTEKDYLVLNDDQQVEYYRNLTKDCTKTILYPHERGDSQPSVFIRPCKKSLPSICPLETSIELARNCSLSPTAYRYVQNSSIIYRNSYCAECNYRNNTDELTCIDPYLRGILPALPMRIYPLTILFDPNLLKGYLNNNQIPRFIYSMDYNCTKSNELYDLFEKKCLPVTNSSQEFIISMKCSLPIQTFIQSDKDILYDNGSLYLMKYSALLTKDEYIFVSDNRVVFCTDEWVNSSTSSSILPSFPFYRNILSVICASISLACLFIFFIIFWLIPSLQNLPGKCLLILSISLFIGQLTFISLSNVTEHPSLCIASAILIHYFYLSSFLWLLIISIHIHSTFNNETIPKDKIDKKNYRLIAYNIIVWCSTGLIILIGCLIQYTNPESNFSPGYGLIFCSISNANAMILFFLVPIGSILLIVGILFIKTLIAIYRTHKIAKLANTSSLSNPKDNNLIFIYSRLASLMGIQWILLIGALVIKQTWLWVVFEIINSLPGVFICFGFLCSTRVFHQLKQKISAKLIIRRQSSRSNTTSSTMLMSPSLPPTNIIKKFRF